MAVVTKDTTIGELLMTEIGCAKFLFEMGMHCVGCPSSQGETLEEACMVHGTDVNELLKNINTFLAEQQAQ
ncbi:MAG: DUF1858 domain-containing protein [Butyricicoccaceae bacterium]